MPEKTLDFNEVLKAEHRSINHRRSRLGHAPVRGTSDIEHPVFDTVGLALSGGGIRSAAISLGVLQALNRHGLLSRIDYLSTVSGGGFIGSSLTATMTATSGRFIFIDETSYPSGLNDSSKLPD